MPAAWVTAGAAVLGAAKSGNGGSSGGNAQPVYQPKNQAGMDDTFNYDYNLYGENVQNSQNLTSPASIGTYYGQLNNQYAPGMMTGMNTAGQQYGNTAGQSSQGSNTLFGQAGQTSDWQTLDRQGMIYNAPQIQKAFNGMIGQADQSNARYGDLMAYQDAQKGNVQGAANQLYSGGNRIMDTAFDPRSAVYNDTAQKLTDQTRAAEYSRGIQMSPYGASVEANTMGNFNMDWQNQQLARQAQGLSSAQGAYQGGQGMNDTYVNNLAGLQEGQGRNYMGLTRGAADTLQNWSQSQANVANTFGGATGGAYQSAAGTGNTAGQMYGASGQVPYAAQNDIYGNQNQAIQNYWGNQSPYLTGLGNQQSQASTYMDRGNIAQNQAYTQNVENQNRTDNMIKGISDPITQGIKSIWPGQQGGAYYGQNTNQVGQQYGSDANRQAIYDANGYYGGV